MDRKVLQERIQLLLSWREQAGRQLRDHRPATPAGRARYEAHGRQAEYYLRQTISQHQRYLMNLGESLQGAIAEAQRIDARLAAGRMRSEDAAMARAELERRTARLREEIAAWNALLRAKRSADAGGFIDLPLEEYAPRLGLKPAARPKDRWELRHYLFITALTIVAAIGGYSYYSNAAAPRLSCEQGYQQAPAEAVTFTLTNTGLTPVSLHVPLPDPLPSRMENGACGLVVLARHGGRPGYQAVLTQPAEWLHLGATMTGQDALEIQPGGMETVALDLRLVRARLDDLQGLRIEATLPSGKVVCAQEWALPAAPLP
jgi:hypothetical protein